MYTLMIRPTHPFFRMPSRSTQTLLNPKAIMALKMDDAIQDDLDYSSPALPSNTLNDSLPDPPATSDRAEVYWPL